MRYYRRALLPSRKATSSAWWTGGNMTAGTTSRAALWVDKYAPRAFMDLLSDERINRHVLRWVKQWDSFVLNFLTRFGAHRPLRRI